MRPEIKTLGQLKKSGYRPQSIKDELRNNLLQHIKNGTTAFEGIHGFEDTVLPDLERAVLSRHNINLLGLRGQAKTRLARHLTHLLDEFVPVVAGSEINDDPFHPISVFARQLIEEKGDNTPISWLNRDERFFEKLATPDVTIADLIGDVDPIKAANLRLSYADDRVIHFGMIPRAHRCIFVINELPDLQARIQVALFNILQEGDVQIRGFKVRLPLDIQFVFTANPEDYTNRGSIVTPLKDRIGSQILTHYPLKREIAKTITAQEAKVDEDVIKKVYIPDLARDLLEQIAIEARDNDFVDAKSGVSARLSITAFENLLSTTERRMLKSGDTETALRLSDFMGIIPAITGKVELVYEGEQEGAAAVALELIQAAILSLFVDYFPKIEKLEKPGASSPYQPVIDWFLEEGNFELPDDLTNDEWHRKLHAIKPLDKIISENIKELKPEDTDFFKEFLLWGLAAQKKLTKKRFLKGHAFSDVYGDFISKL